MVAGPAVPMPSQTKLTALPRVVWVLAGGSFVNNFGGFVVPFLVLYLVHRGYSPAVAAAAVSAYAVGKIAAGPAGGRLTERLGARAVTVASMTGSAVTTLALAAAAGPGPILLVAALTGFAAELYRPSTSAIMAAEVPEPQRVKAFGAYQLGVSAGATAGPAVGGLLAEHSFLGLFGCDAATSLAWAFLAWRALPAAEGKPAAARQPFQARDHGLLGDRRLLRLLAVTVLVNVVLFQAQTTLPIWVRQQGLSTGAYGLLLALNSGLVLALQLPATRLTGRWRPQPVIAASSVLVGAGFGLLALAHTIVLPVAAVIIWSLGELAQWPVAAAYTTRLAPSGMAARYAGARSLCYGTALLLAPLAGTALYRLNRDLPWAMSIVAAACAAAIIAPRRRPRVNPPAPPGGRHDHHKHGRAADRTAVSFDNGFRPALLVPAGTSLLGSASAIFARRARAKAACLTGAGAGAQQERPRPEPQQPDR